jgi:hypothetical protein
MMVCDQDMNDTVTLAYIANVACFQDNDANQGLSKVLGCYQAQELEANLDAKVVAGA